MAKKRGLLGRIPVPAKVEHGLDAALDKVMRVERPAVQAYLGRVRDKQPGASPAEVVQLLERRYRTLVMGIGAASGGAAALPGVGTAGSIATGAAEIAAFVSATGMFVLALAELHDVPVSDPDVRRALVLAALVGEPAALAVDGVSREGGSWAAVLGRRGSKDAVGGLNGRLGRLLLTRFGTRQGALVLGRAVPFGIGAGIGAAGNAALARGAIRSARRTFGPAAGDVPGPGGRRAARPMIDVVAPGARTVRV